MIQEAERAQHGEDVDVVVAEAHPESDAVGVDVLVERVQFVVAVQVDRALSGHREVVDALHRVGRVLFPLPVDPGPDLNKLAEVDFRVEVGGKIFTVTAGVDVQDVDGVDLVEVVLLRQGAVGVDHAGVEAHAEDGGQSLGGAAVLALPLVVGVPGRVFADLVRILMDGGVQVDGAGLDAGFQHGHVDEGLAEIEDDAGVGLANQADCGGDVQRFDLPGIQAFRRIFEMVHLPDAGDDRVAFGLSAGGDANVAQHVVVHGRLVRRHMRDAAGAEDEEIVLLHIRSFVVRSLDSEFRIQNSEWSENTPPATY